MASGLMGVKTFDDQWGQQVTVLGPCPGCDSWQLDYTNAVAQEWIIFGVDPSRDSWTDAVVVVTDLWYQVVEDILAEHLRECPHLRDLVEHY